MSLLDTGLYKWHSSENRSVKLQLQEGKWNYKRRQQNNAHFNGYHLSQLMRFWYLSHRWPAKAQASLRIRAVSLEPSLFAHMKYGSRRRVWPKIRHLAPLDGCACGLKNEFTEDEKYHNLMSWLNYYFIPWLDFFKILFAGEVLGCSGGGLLALMSMYRFRESRTGGDIGDCTGVHKEIPLSCNPLLPVRTWFSCFMKF